MNYNDRFAVSALDFTNWSTVEIKDISVSLEENICCVQLTFQEDHLNFIVLQGTEVYKELRLNYFINTSRFLDFSEDEWNLNCMVDNVPQKYLKFIVGLYKLHTNQISTSELEQLVLDNIEDLL